MTLTAAPSLYMRPDRNLALELVRVTEAGAMAAGRWVGRGDKKVETEPPSTQCADWWPPYPCAESS
jgi:hypothetical protein